MHEIILIILLLLLIILFVSATILINYYCIFNVCNIYDTWYDKRNDSDHIVYDKRNDIPLISNKIPKNIKFLKNH